MRIVYAVAACALLSFGCTADFATQSQADSILRIAQVVGQPGGSQDDGVPLLSDVCCGIINDNAALTFQLIEKNQSGTQIVSPFSDVQLERYEVSFRRSDGHNQQGVDVPFTVTGAMDGIIPVGGTFTTSIIIVRHQAKLEPPLRNLHDFFPAINGGTIGTSGEGILTTIADITIHGRTTSGKTVEAHTLLEVVFADFNGEG